MKKIDQNSTVVFNYVVKSDEGRVLSDSEKSGMVKFKMNDKNLIPALQEELIGMEVGEKRSFFVDKQRGFGEIKDELIQGFSRDVLAGNQVENNTVIKLKDKQGNILKPTVVSQDEKTVTLDFNHPFAGKDLHFEVVISDILEE
jgi:FKBP-type peptidyl-prolyl cis-trans isomerase 2